MSKRLLNKLGLSQRGLNCEIGKLFDHFVGRRLNGQGRAQAERLRGLEVDGEFVPVSSFLCGDRLGSASVCGM